MLRRHVPRNQATKGSIAWSVAAIAVLFVGAVFGFVAMLDHLWEDDRIARILHWRTDVVKLGSVQVATKQTPCIVRDDNAYDCIPQTITVDTTPAFSAILSLANAGSLSVVGSSSSVGLYGVVDTARENADSCADDPAFPVPIDDRFVAIVIDKAHHRTVYVPCEGMVYVVPDAESPPPSPAMAFLRHVNDACAGRELATIRSSTTLARVGSARDRIVQ